MTQLVALKRPTWRIFGYKRKLFFNNDNTLGFPFKEIDDGLTLLYLLTQTNIDLLGISTTFGNGLVKDVNKATQQQLRLLNRDDIAVYTGAGQPGAIRTTAAVFLAESATAHPGEISILATGPLTNLLGVSCIDPDF